MPWKAISVDPRRFGVLFPSLMARFPAFFPVSAFLQRSFAEVKFVSHHRFSPQKWAWTSWTNRAITGMLVLAASLASGCGGRAHSDVYQQRMASEIRVLEDQLYDADYQNRVLNDQLQKYDQKVEASRIPTPDELGVAPQDSPLAASVGIGQPTAIELPPPAAPGNLESGFPSASPDLSTNGLSSDGFDPMASGLETESAGVSDFNTNDFNESLFDMGDPMAPEQLHAEPINTEPIGSEQAGSSKTDSSDPQPLTDPDTDRLQPENPFPRRKPKLHSLPPPVGVSPPGKKDTQVDPIVPGDIAPPSRDAGEEKPPGQILLPQSTQTPTGAPQRLRIHPTLSTGHRDGQKLDGATLVLSVLDRLGRNVDLNQFDVQAELSVVVLDPDRDAAKARIGRWNFDAKQVTAMIAAQKDGGLEIPVRWKSKTPRTDKVIVHVRLRGDEEEMRCQSKLDLRPRTAASTWTPRGE